jgi:DNA invertase Pin-like site-specific DNA recombinase
MTIKPTAHLYARISDEVQRKGTGIERQTTANTQEFCKHFGFALGKKIYIDDGVSAWKGLNATPEHELGKFLADANRGLIHKGDCLLIENYDRLSRQDVWAAMSLVNDLRQLHIHVGRLDRQKILRYDSKDIGDFFEAAVEFSRGNSESNIKSERIGKAWILNREKARGKGEPPPGKLPYWIRRVDGKSLLVPERLAVIRYIFRLACSGYGTTLMARKLVETGHPPFGDSGEWTPCYLRKILTGREVLGEFKAYSGGKQVGDVFICPQLAIVTADEWYEAQKCIADREKKRGKQGRHINVFAGLMWNAYDHDAYYVATTTENKKGEKKHQRVLKNIDGAEGRTVCRSFPFATFEAAILSHLREVDPHEIFNGKVKPDETKVLAGKLAVAESEFKVAVDLANEHPLSKIAGTRAIVAESRVEELKHQLREARRKALHPLSEVWGECQSLIDTINMASDPNEMRLRLQTKLRDIVGGIWLLVVARGRTRLCAAQVWFKRDDGDQDKHRDYLIAHIPPKANSRARTDGGWWSRSLADVAKLGLLDLRKRHHSQRLEKLLTVVDLSALEKC